MTSYTLPTVTEEERLFGIAGDWHFDWRWANRKLEEFYENGVKTIFHLGDFGIWPRQIGEEFLGKLRKQLTTLGQTIYVTLGNHEDYDQIDHMDADEMGIKWARPNIALLPRPFRFNIHGYEFLSLGGAPTINFQDCVLGHDWWLQEMLTDEQVDLAIAGGPADIMFAHDAPSGGTRAVQDIILRNPQGWSKESTDYANVGRERMTRAVQTIKPQIFMHGHYHVKDSGWLNYGEGTYPGIIHSLPCNQMPYNTGILDIDDIYELKPCL